MDEWMDELEVWYTLLHGYCNCFVRWLVRLSSWVDDMMMMMMMNSIVADWKSSSSP
jgi:hypothetical protein